MQIEKGVRHKNIEQGMLENQADIVIQWKFLNFQYIRFVISCIYSLVSNRIYLIPSQTNMQLGFCGKELGTLKYSRSKVLNARKKDRKTNRTICWAL